MTDPAWNPTTEEELASAAAQGLLEETHNLDIKRGSVKVAPQTKDRRTIRPPSLSTAVYSSSAWTKAPLHQPSTPFRWLACLSESNK
jgi:hypothetical protein